jgi:hypothetical protein
MTYCRTDLRNATSAQDCDPRISRAPSNDRAKFIVLVLASALLLVGCGKSGDDCIESPTRIVGPLPEQIDALSGAELLARRESLDGRYVDTVGTLIYEAAGKRAITGEHSDLVLVYLDDVALRTGWRPGAVSLRLLDDEVSKAKAMSGLPVRVLGLFRSRPAEFANVPEPAGEITRVVILQTVPLNWPERQTLCPAQVTGGKSGAGSGS